MASGQNTLVVVIEVRLEGTNWTDPRPFARFRQADLSTAWNRYAAPNEGAFTTRIMAAECITPERTNDPA